MDSLHFYCYHLFDVGLRILSQDNKQESDDEDDDDEEIKNEDYDFEFARINKNINNRIHLSQSFNRFKGKDKFTITTATKPGIFTFCTLLLLLFIAPKTYLIILCQMKQEQHLLIN